MISNKDYTAFLTRVQDQQARLRETLPALLQTDSAFKTLEIGSGHGDFLVRYAQQFPERFCCGIDVNNQRILTSQRKANRTTLTNCHFLKVRAEEFLLCQPAEFLWSEVIVLYPDPWPKRRHHKHRLFQQEFLSQLALRVIPAAKIHFETDDADYFHSVETLIQAHPSWQAISGKTYKVDTVFSHLTGSRGFHAVFQHVTP